MKYLCIDYGLARTGIAVSDAGGHMAFPRCTVAVPPQGKKTDFWQKLLHIIAEEAPGALVVGLPLLPDGTESLTTRQVRNFLRSLSRRTPLPIYAMPELLSSYAAQSDLQYTHLSAQARKAVLDQQAAVRILESFLADPGMQDKLFTAAEPRPPATHLVPASPPPHRRGG